MHLAQISTNRNGCKETKSQNLKIINLSET